MNRKPLLNPMSLTQAFTDIQVRSDREKLRHNSADDHGLRAKGYYYLIADNDVMHPEDGWISPPGKTRCIGDWHCRYAKPCQALVDACLPLCLEGAIGSFDVKRWRDPERIALLFTDSTMIATYFVCELFASTLFQKIVAAGIDFDHHESDLYIENTSVAMEILKSFPLNKKNARDFISETDGEAWIDVPFAYEPWWIKRRMS